MNDTRDRRRAVPSARAGAAAEKRTLSDVTQEVLRRGLRADTGKRKRAPVKLPTFTMGRPLVDVADRDQLYAVLDRG